jgi:hypothetical protein
MSRFTDVMATAFANTMQTAPAPAPINGTENTPHRMQRAIQRAQKLEKRWLTQDELLDFLDLLENNSKLAAAYGALDFDDEEFRKAWVKKKLNIIW